MRKHDKYGRRLTDRQCVLCQKVDTIFGFTFYADSEGAVCHRCARDAVSAALQPKYPLPTKIGEVQYLSDMIIVEDCDGRFDPQCVWYFLSCTDEYPVTIACDQPSDSPNYR